MNNIRGLLDEEALNKLDEFYWTFIYAKYTSNPKIMMSLAKPLVKLIREKLKYLDLNPTDEKHDRDKLMLLSVSDKQMAALNVFMF